MRDDERSLVRPVVIDVGDDLHGHIGLTGSGRSDHHSEARLHARLDRLDLERTTNRIPVIQ